MDALRSALAWNTEWTWSDLRDRVRDVPDGPAAVDELARTVPIRGGRALFRQLLRLTSIAEVRRVPARSALDRPTARAAAAHQELERQLAGIAPRSDLAGLLQAAVRLSAARARLRDPFLPDLSEAPAPERAVVARAAQPAVELTLDVSGALGLLNLLRRGRAADAEWRALAGHPAYRALLARTGAARLTRDQMIAWWMRAADGAPTNRLYEWAFPGSYFDYGAAAVAADDYEAALRLLASRAAALERAVSDRVAPLAPGGVRVRVVARILFAGEANGWTVGDEVGIALEHFGNDEAALARVLAHESCHRLQAAALLPDWFVADDAVDARLADGLLYRVWAEGLASRAARPWPVEPDGASVSAGFGDVEAAFGDLCVRRDGPRYRADLERGTQGSGAFYRAGWAMCRTIGDRLGAGALRQAMVLGPAAFFRAYDRAASAPAPAGGDLAAPRYSERFRAAIDRLWRGQDEGALIESAAALREVTASRAERRSRTLLARWRGKRAGALAMLLAGERMARARRPDLARDLICEGLRGLNGACGDRVRRAGQALQAAGGDRQAVDVFRVGADLAPRSAERRFLLGQALRMAGDPAAARDSFRRALSLEPGYEPAERALAGAGR